MINILALSATPQKTILDVFNKSFSDYLVPLQLTAIQFENKLLSESVDLSLSIGIFENDTLIGFILHGVDIIDGKKVLYNAGTGVIPEKRGNHYISKAYNTFLPVLRSNNIDTIILEVIEGNDKAINVYKHIGFTKTGEYSCYKGRLSNFKGGKKNDFIIKISNEHKWDKFASFWNFNPTWQNSCKALEQLKDSNVCLCAFQQELIIGYLIYNPISKKIQQFGVDKNFRRHGVGNSLFEFLKSCFTDNALITNIDVEDSSTNRFLKSLGLNQFAVQYQMQLQI